MRGGVHVKSVSSSQQRKGLEEEGTDSSLETFSILCENEVFGTVFEYLTKLM